MLRSCRSLLNSAIDLLWPHLAGGPEPEPSGDAPAVDATAKTVNAVEAALAIQTAQGAERGRQVDAKLLALLTLTSTLAAAVTVGVTVALGANLAGTSLWFFVPVALSAAYVLLQMVRSVQAIINGLSVRGYRMLTRADCDPQAGETDLAYRKRIWKVRRYELAYNDWAINNKVSDMKVALVALKNAIRGTSVLVIVAMIIAVIRR